MLLETGRICIKKFGRDAGCKAVIVAVEKNGFVRVISAGRKKERLVNAKHLELLNEVVDAKDRDKVNRALGIQEAAKANYSKK
jgi:ribosomal protein L14E/L6E/L27E